MRTILKLVLVALGLAFAAPAFAQDAAVCQQALLNLAEVRDGKSPPIGIEADGMRLKASGGYKAAGDAAMFAVDAYREHGDVRGLCPESKWPASMKPDALKKTLTQAAKTNAKVFCGGDPMISATAPKMIRGWQNNAGIEFFSDRILELQAKLDTTAGVKNQSAGRHASDSDWLFEVASDLDEACPNGEAALDIGSARISANRAREFAHDNVNFLVCVKAREGWQPAMKDFDAVAPANDPTSMAAAYRKIETAAVAVKAACKASEEGSRENDYLLAARRLRILFLTTPGCREAAIKMNDIRQSMNTADKSSLPSYVTDIRNAAKEAGVACKDPAAETWGEFVAWITEKNYFRVADKQ